MKRISLSIIFCAALFTTSCKDDKKGDDMDDAAETEMGTDMNQDSAQNMEDKKVTVTLQSKSGSNLSGNVVFYQEGEEVRMEAIISGLAEGEHAIHIHENADCSAEDGSSAGGHWNPTNAPHGKWGSSDGYHKGDIGNFNVDASGNGTVNLTTDEWCIGCGDANKDILGKAIIVHDGVDDYTSQPSGDAGNRVGCATITM